MTMKIITIDDDERAFLEQNEEASSPLQLTSPCRHLIVCKANRWAMKALFERRSGQPFKGRFFTLQQNSGEVACGSSVTAELKDHVALYLWQGDERVAIDPENWSRVRDMIDDLFETAAAVRDVMNPSQQEE